MLYIRFFFCSVTTPICYVFLTIVYVFIVLSVFTWWLHWGGPHGFRATAGGFRDAPDRWPRSHAAKHAEWVGGLNPLFVTMKESLCFCWWLVWRINFCFESSRCSCLACFLLVLFEELWCWRFVHWVQYFGRVFSVDSAVPFVSLARSGACTLAQATISAMQSNTIIFEVSNCLYSLQSKSTSICIYV